MLYLHVTFRNEALNGKQYKCTFKGRFVQTAAGMHCCFNRGTPLYRCECSTTGWLSLEHHRAVTRGTSHFHANQCHGDPAAALWCKWAVTTRGGRRRREEERRGEGDLGDFVKVEALQELPPFHTNIRPYSTECMKPVMRIPIKRVIGLFGDDWFTRRISYFSAVSTYHTHYWRKCPN